MGRPLKIKKTTTVDIAFPAKGTLTNPDLPDTLNSDEYIGVLGGVGNGGGVATTAYPVLKVRAYIAGASEDDAFILRQKGSTKYLVEDVNGNQGVCVLANEADGVLSEGNMNITFTTGDSTATTIKRLTNKYAIDYSDNKYLVNFWTDEGTVIKSGTTGSTYTLGIVEKYTT